MAMEEPWFVELKGGEYGRTNPVGGDRYRHSHAYLVDPPSGQRVPVPVSVTTGHETLVLLGPLSAEKPGGVALLSTHLLKDEFWLKHDSTGAVVRFQGYLLHPLAPPSDSEEQVVLGDVEAVDPEDDIAAPEPTSEALPSDEELSDEEEMEFEGLSDEEYEDLYDSDGSEDESDGEDEPLKIRADGDAAEGSSGGGSQLVTAPFVPEGKFLGPAQFASAGSTAGFMRVAAVEADQAAGSQEEGKEILVLYRYTRFSRTWSGRQGVEVCRRTKLHRLRFIVPPAGDPASSLPWAGSSLAQLIYPDLYSKQLQELWSSLVTPVSIPPQATRVQVMIDVGILREGDDTPERMEHMRRELEAKTEEAWPGYHIGMELHLPEPVLCKEDEADDDTSEREDGARPAKRRRVIAGIAGEECPVCFELLESGLAAWPGCSVPHVFHGACLELTLKGSDRCPICRRALSLKPTRPS